MGSFMVATASGGGRPRASTPKRCTTQVACGYTTYAALLSTFGVPHTCMLPFERGDAQMTRRVKSSYRKRRCDVVAPAAAATGISASRFFFCLTTRPTKT